MKISLAQINPTVGDIQSNYKLIVKHAKIAQESNAEILITPELSICGYPPEDLLLNKDFIDECNDSLIKVAQEFPELRIIIVILEAIKVYYSTRHQFSIKEK